MLGFLSQMISLQFNELTAEEGEFARLSPTLDPDKLGIAMPPDYKGDNLRLITGQTRLQRRHYLSSISVERLVHRVVHEVDVELVHSHSL